MLENIKSLYYLKILFSLLDDGIKLNLFRYNKNFQTKIDINIMNYKRFANKYIIKEDNKVKEYNIYNDELIFEGEYLNGKRNGKGKEYNKEGKLEFEGEYLNGKRWNGKCYNINNNISYELNNGKGYVTDFNGNENLIFEGELINGEKNGKAKEYSYSGGFLFDGEYLKGKKNGKCREFKENYLIFKGEYLNGKKWNGRINIENDYNIIYELKNGKGYFIEVMNDKSSLFEGEFLNGLRNGKGKEYIKLLRYTLYFEGEYLNGKRNGKGKEYFYDKLKFEGEYLYNHKWKGKEYVKGKLEYEGEYLFDKKWNGKGMLKMVI